MSGRSARALRNMIASNKFDLPTALPPAMQVNRPKERTTSRRFLNPDTFRRVSIGYFLETIDHSATEHPRSLSILISATGLNTYTGSCSRIIIALLLYKLYAAEKSDSRIAKDSAAGRGAGGVVSLRLTWEQISQLWSIVVTTPPPARRRRRPLRGRTRPRRPGTSRGSSR